MTKHLFPIVFLSLILIGCKKDPIVDDPTPTPNPYTQTDIQFLGHKGSGNNNYNDVFFEQTMPSIQNALLTLDGVEVDIQMSTDGTIWLYHNSDLANYCDTNDTRSLITQPDSVLEKLILCHNTKTARLYKLQELIDYWNSTSKGFYISLEVKTAFSSVTFDSVGGKAAYMDKLATALTQVLATRNHNGQLLVEVNYAPFVTKVKQTMSGLLFCLLSEDDILPKITKALQYGYEGISCNYNDESVTVEGVKMAQDSGLIVQVWTPYYQDELIKAFNLKPDFIQTDNVDAKEKLMVQ